MDVPYNPARRASERIDWGGQRETVVQDIKPSAKYGKVSESLRQSLPAEKICSMFCGGKKCKYCTADTWTDDQKALPGLYSHWITENILACARPSKDLIQTHDLYEEFHKSGIQSIINLQLPGEHASCGPGLQEDGFSYVPQEFMDNNVFFYNFGWQDYGVGSLDNLLDMVRVMQFALSEGKVAVHCHAGLGRTGVLIASYLVFTNRLPPDEAILYVRHKRPGSIQTQSQIDFIREFGSYLLPLRVVFAQGSKEFTLHQFLKRQSKTLHGLEGRNLKHLPKVLFICMERLLELAGAGVMAVPSLRRQPSMDFLRQSYPRAFNNTSREAVHEDGPLPEPDQAGPSGRGSDVTRCDSDQESIASTRSSADLMREMGSRIRMAGQDLNTTHPEDAHHAAVRVAETVAYPSNDVTEKVDMYVDMVNNDSDAWMKLKEENDPQVLAGLYWTWLDHLKEPVLIVQDLPIMLNEVDPMMGLSRLGKGARCVCEYTLRGLSHLLPLSERLECDLIQRAFSVLTHQNMSTDHDLTKPGSLIRLTRNQGEMSSAMANEMLAFALQLWEIYLDQSALDLESRPSDEASADREMSRSRQMSGMRRERSPSLRARRNRTTSS